MPTFKVFSSLVPYSRQQELLRIHRYPTLLVPVPWVRECLDYLLRTIYLEGCCKTMSELLVPRFGRLVLLCRGKMSLARGNAAYL